MKKNLVLALFIYFGRGIQVVEEKEFQFLSPNLRGHDMFQRDD